MKRAYFLAVAVSLVMASLTLFFVWRVELNARNELFASTAHVFTSSLEVTAIGITTGYFQWTEMRDNIAAGRTADYEPYLAELVRKYKSVKRVYIERSAPPPSPYSFEAAGEQVYIRSQISNSAGEKVLPDFRATAVVDAARILEEAQVTELIRLVASGGRPFAYGLRADFVDGPVHGSDFALALLIGLLSGLPVVLLLKRNSRFFYESKGLETIIFLFEQSERYSANHSRKVAELAAFIGTTEGLHGKRLRDLYAAALLHDIGKISTPLEILLKPAALDPEERDSIKMHPGISAHILANFDELAHLAEFVLRHHERVDGTGYPSGFTAADIPLESRIIAIADVFEALTGQRPYREAMDPGAAFAIMDGAGLDPELLGRFERSYPRYAEYKLPRWAVRWLPS